MTSESFNLGIKRGDVFSAVIVGEEFETEVFEHGGAFLRATLFRIKGNDAPGHEIGMVEKGGVEIGGVFRSCKLRMPWECEEGKTK